MVGVGGQGTNARCWPGRAWLSAWHHQSANVPHPRTHHTPQINAKVTKTTHMKEMNLEMEKLKQMLLATREKNGARCRWRLQARCGGEHAATARCATGMPWRYAGRGLTLCHACTRPPPGVYLPAAQYDQECEERRQLRARVEELEAEAEAVGAQHELDKAEWEAETARQAVAHEKAIGEVGGARHRGGWRGTAGPVCAAATLAHPHPVPMQVRAELATTQEELRQARLAIQERDFAIARHQHCEAQLAEHAGALNQALAGAAADVALLFQRWDEKNELEDANTALVQVRWNGWAVVAAVWEEESGALCHA